MRRIAAALPFSLIIASAQVVPIIFTGSTHTAFALAEVDGMLDRPFDGNSPPDPLPITPSATVTDADGSAAAYVQVLTC